ncbi:MAG: argininosuccinate synthase [Armatimonadota bacterium]|nr:argininosuccinate synthase [Armatimonadota bacterium]
MRQRGETMKTVVLVYSGGLDTSVCIPMMREDYGFERVVTVTIDVGQPEEDIKVAAEKAKALGTEHYTVDAKDEFAREYIFPAVKANGDYQGYPLSTAIARPLISLKAVDVAKKVGGDAFCHGCTGKGNDQFRIEFVMMALAPDLAIIAPMREKNLTRIEEIEYAKAHNVPIAQSIDKIWSVDENMWGRSIEGGRLEEPDYFPPEEIYEWTVSPREAPDKVEELAVGFENGVPVSLNGQIMPPVELIMKVKEIAGRNGVGRIDVMEDRMLGLKVRENYECPAAVTLITAHKALEALVCTKDELFFKSMVDRKWGELAYAGLWFDPLKEDLEAFINKIQERVTGVVHLRLYKGSVTVAGRSSKFALYSEDLASFDSKTFVQSEMTGAVKVHGLQARMYRGLKRK